MKLYKFCSGEFLEENLRRGQIYLGMIMNCNDPYEGALNFSINTDLLADFVSIYYPFGINFSFFRKNDVIQKIQYYLMNSFKTKKGVACFSEIVDSMTMWGHYADKQSGICLEFEKRALEKYKIEKVRYQDNVPRIKILKPEDLSKDKFEQQYNEAGFTKSKEWAYEKEWRIIGNSGDFVFYDKSALTGIYFGFKVEKDFVKRIFKATKEFPNLKYYKPGLKLDEYGVSFFEVTETDLSSKN